MIKNCSLEYFRENEKILITKERKELFGEINTPFSLIEDMFSVIPERDFHNPFLKWLDPGTGSGNFSIFLYFKLVEGLKEIIIDIDERKDHIIKNMIFMSEIQTDNIFHLKKIFGNNANIYFGDFLQYSSIHLFDYIIGNPPFNGSGLKKVPTNSSIQKREDGFTIWPFFIRKSITLLKPQCGRLCTIIPSIWLKPDKAKIYQLLTKYKIEYLNCLTNTESNKIFKGNAQTPCCYFLLTKRETDNIISIFDKTASKYINYNLKENKPIPVFAQEAISILSKFLPKSKGGIPVIKTNMPPKSVFLSPEKNEICIYPNISTCIQEKTKGKTPKLIINYSDKPLAFHNQPKLVLAHKMYGLPYLDEKGEYGISNRDNYVILPKENNQEGINGLIKLKYFLSTKTALFLFKSTTYRMKYLERYVFELVPDIRKLCDFPKEINDKTISQYFGI